MVRVALAGIGANCELDELIEVGGSDVENGDQITKPVLPSQVVFSTFFQNFLLNFS